MRDERRIDRLPQHAVSAAPADEHRVGCAAAVEQGRGDLLA